MKAIRGSLWSLGGYGGAQMLRAATSVILAWFLFREAFGLMALVIVFMQGLKMFSDIGLGPSIIQSKRGDDPGFLNTAWTIQIIRGFSLWLVACALAWPMAALYAKNDPLAWQLVYLIPVASLTAVLSGFNSPALYTLTRRLDLGRLTIREIGSKIVFLGVAVGWAVVHPSVWALVAGGLASNTYTLIVSHRLVPEVKVRLQWDPSCTKELFRFGKWIFLSTALTFFTTNFDKLALGGVLTMGELGLYAIALVFSKVALRVVGRLTQAVLFPLLAKFQDDPAKVVRKCLEARQATLVVGGAVCVGVAIIAPWFFGILYPPEFADAGTIAQWLCVYMWFSILLSTTAKAPLALGNSRSTFMVSVFRLFGIGGAIGGYVSAGLPGFIVGRSLGSVVGLVYIIWWLPVGRWKMTEQSLVMTLIFGAYAGVALGLVATVNGALPEVGKMALAAALAGLPAIPAAWYVSGQLRGKKRAREPVAAVPVQA